MGSINLRCHLAVASIKNTDIPGIQTHAGLRIYLISLKKAKNINILVVVSHWNGDASIQQGKSKYCVVNWLIFVYKDFGFTPL